VSQPEQEFSWDFYDFTGGLIRAFQNQTIKTTVNNTVNITIQNATLNISKKPEIQTSYKGIGSFLLTPSSSQTPFLELVFNNQTV
jgi:hypothetical protein